MILQPRQGTFGPRCQHGMLAYLCFLKTSIPGRRVCLYILPAGLGGRWAQRHCTLQDSPTSRRQGSRACPSCRQTCVTNSRESESAGPGGAGRTTSSFQSPSGSWLHLLFVGLALILYFFFSNEGFSDLPNLRFYPALLMNEKVTMAIQYNSGICLRIKREHSPLSAVTLCPK